MTQTKKQMSLSDLIDESAEGYSGEVAPALAYDYLAAHKNAALIDVRTQPEWQFIGMACLDDIERDVHLISWMHYPYGTENQQFAEQLAQAVSDKSSPLFFICRSGKRSQAAAKFATSEGYTHCFNIEDGFEGRLNAESQRGKRNGWKASNLPWSQT